MSDPLVSAHWQADPARAYAPTHAFDGSFIDADHEAISRLERNGIALKSDIAGWLQIDDALKLYELAYFTTGDVLELGTYQGLSASFMALALLNAGGGFQCDSIELDPRQSDFAYENLDQRDLNCVVRLHVGDGAAVCRKLIALGKTYGLAFVDHSHGFEDVLAANELIKSLITPGGYLVFHDFTDPRNTTRQGVGDDPNEFGVRYACDVGFADGSFTFLGTCGACGIYRKV